MELTEIAVESLKTTLAGRQFPAAADFEQEPLSVQRDNALRSLRSTAIAVLNAPRARTPRSTSFSSDKSKE